MWSILNKEDGKIVLQNTGVTQKYLCTIDSNIQIGTLNIATTTECRWLITIKNVIDNGYRLEILTLDNKVVNTNNPSVYDVAALNNLFKEIYNELDVNVDLLGNLKSVNNVNQIRSKWEVVRSQLNEMTANRESITNVIQLNDNIFESDANIFHTIAAVEFFEIFFNGVYGKSIPYTGYPSRKSKFQAVDVDWVLRYNYSGNDQYHILFEGEPQKKVSPSWLQSAYGHFIFLEPATLVPFINCKGDYLIDNQTGMVKKATYYTEETVHTQLLYNKIKYTLNQY